MSAPPANWKTLYNKLQVYRRQLKAPVDTVGCGLLYDKNVSTENRRYHILVALMLSSQTKDPVTAKAMSTLLHRGLTPKSVVQMSERELDDCIAKVSFHNTKTRHIKAVASILLSTYGGCVPREYDQLLALPGVGPKMAHLFLQEADNRVLGIGVDTHVHRISRRFGWTPVSTKTPEDTRKALESWLPKEHWAEINGLMVGLGQTICTPLRPRCAECLLADCCPNAFKECQLQKKRPKATVFPDVEDIGEAKPSVGKRKKMLTNSYEPATEAIAR